jgi:hypothetical protein
MAFTYTITQNSSDSHQAEPFWIGVVVPFKFKDTFNRNNFATSDNANVGSIPDALKNPVEEDDIIIIDNDCVSWSTGSTKGSHTTHLDLSLKQTAIEYINKVKPGDWILFWAFNDFEKYNYVKNLINTRKRANQFFNAPKFIGRINSVLKDKAVQPNSGQIHLFYSINCTGFSELDNTIYYNLAAGFKYPNARQEWRDFGNEINSFLTTGGVVTAHDAIVKLTGICLGLGPGIKWKRVLDLGSAVNNLSVSPDTFLSVQDTVISPNESYLIPPTVAKLLTGKSSNINTYADLLRLLVGLQKYKNYNTGIINKKNDIVDFKGFFPDLVEMTGQFQPQTLDFNNAPLWSLLQTYLNPPMNEMFTCLRVDGEGYVMPTLIARQVPFSTNKFANSLPRQILSSDRVDINATAFTSLPRWNIDKTMIMHLRVGASNAVRYNYVQILGLNLLNPNGSIIQKAKEQIYQKPIIDTADIQRTGLNTYIKNTNSYYSTVNISDLLTLQFWSKLMADTLLGSHLKFSGTVTLKGVNEPICEGDNCVIDGVIYHIEGFNHSGQIDETGHKDFTTTLMLTNGVAIESDNSEDLIYPTLKETDIGITFERN